MLEGKMPGTSDLDTISTRRQQIANLAKRVADKPLLTLAHHIDIIWLNEAYRRTRKDAAAGIDGVTAATYEQNLQGNLLALLEQAKAGTYFAPPVRRVHIPKGDGSKTRALGLPTFEDKVLQRAVVMVLQEVYEPVFHADSYGYRPGRSAQQALDALRSELMAMGGGWVLEADIEAFFDRIEREHLTQALRQRVLDGVLLKLVGKWLNAGVMEEGKLLRPDAGTPQGGVISPLLANVFLNEVLDAWFEREVKPRLHGRARLIRFADDFVIVFAEEQDARRVFEVLPKRFEKYGLKLHPKKTRLIEFRPRPPTPLEGKEKAPRETFELLGFTHYWGLARWGGEVVKVKTASARLRRTLKRMTAVCRRIRHEPVKEQWEKLKSRLRGHNTYFGRPGNSASLARVLYETKRIWRKWLNRRSQKPHMPWERMAKLLQRYPLRPPFSPVRTAPTK